MRYQLRARDYDLKYRGTHVSYRSDNENLPFFVEQINEDNGIIFSGRILSSAKEKPEWTPRKIRVDDSNLILDFPTLGYINLISGFSFILKRKAHKQYKEGFYPEVIEIVDPFLTERTFLKRPTIDSIINKSLLHCVFNNKFFTLKEAIDKVIALDRVSAAFDGNWCVGIKHNPNRICLLRDEYVVGVISGNNVTVKKELIFLKEEIEFFGLRVVCNE